ncbi:ABC transporter ATP-binding protein [Proteiniborus sp. MB09-C3]|uniref:ABC transporter ATP-binding protein n=1 Tax=Proteiniborus sp. MB09-C3 TaxID=3050072 RepID=UPI002554B516|nr:ABC transporter ATP-binding protein [Proteiniborus sp. MB09-C3]WIV12474.1 ABC transporter ATP-binding protein [Proteiniborus sp. MB09-C3]
MREKNENSSFRRLNQLSPFIKPLRGWIILNCIAAFLEGLIMIYFAFATRSLTDMAMNRQISEFKSFVCFTVVIVAVSIIVSYINKYSSVRYKGDFAYDIRNYFAKHIIDLPLKTKEKYHSGDIISRINNDILTVTELVGNIPELVLNPVMFIAAFIYMYSISWKLLILSVVLIPLTGYIFNIVSKPMEKNSRQIMEDTAKINALAKDAISGVYILKAFNLEGVLLEKYKKNIEGIINRGVKIERINANLVRLFLALRYIPQLIVPLFGGYLAIKGEITVGQLLASTQLIWYVFIPVESLLGLKKHMRTAMPAIDRTFEIINEEIELQAGEKLKIKENYPAVGFSEVSFGYKEENQVLNNISFELTKGTVTAIVGPSGCGKTTVLKLLCSFYRSYKGDIEVLGNNLMNCSPTDIRRNISYVSQSIYLFPATIFENIAYGRDGAKEDEIIEAARLANAHDLIMSLPNGYNTVIGDGSVKLSGGEQQRISLARAILKDAPILLLDEATSALDLESEGLVQKSLQEFMKNRTVLVVAHRMSTIKNVDMILVIKDGEIVEKGVHEELIGRDSFYRRLYNKQFDFKDSEGGIAYA